jgi:adhesin transport system membrane fusion protein
VNTPVSLQLCVALHQYQEYQQATAAYIEFLKADPEHACLLVSGSLDAFDYSIYGSLTGHLSYISSDTLNEQVSGESLTYYRVNVLLDDDATVKNSRLAGVALKPGMTANVSIRTGTRTVLRYLIKPIQRGFQGALSEG